MRKKERKNKIIKLREENEAYKKEINNLYLHVKKLNCKISENNRMIEQYERDFNLNETLTRYK